MTRLSELVDIRNARRRDLIEAEMNVDACMTAMEIANAEAMARSKGEALPERPTLEARVKRYMAAAPRCDGGPTILHRRD